MLRIERFNDLQGRPLAGFFVRNGADKVVAVGAACADGFVMPSQKRYCRDLDLCRAISRLTNQPIKWNLTFWCNHVTSHNRQDLMRSLRRDERTGRWIRVTRYRASVRSEVA